MAVEAGRHRLDRFGARQHADLGGGNGEVETPASICAATKSAGTSNTPATPRVFCA